MVSLHSKLPEDELLDLRVIETYVPAFMVIMKTLAILGLIPLLSSLGFQHGSIYTLVATLLFVDRHLHTYYLNPGSCGREKRLMDSNMSVCCVLLCFVVNSSRAVDFGGASGGGLGGFVGGLGVKEVLLNLVWCFIALWLLLKDELPLLRLLGLDIGFCPTVCPMVRSMRSDYRPEVIPSAVMFYMHSCLPFAQASMLELSVRSISFQCLTVGWYYTYKIRNPPTEDSTFIMSMVRFMPVLFITRWLACVFGGVVWVCIMVRFYQEQSVLSNRLAGNVENPAVLQVVEGYSHDNSHDNPQHYPPQPTEEPARAVNSEDLELFREALRQNNKL